MKNLIIVAGALVIAGTPAVAATVPHGKVPISRVKVTPPKVNKPKSGHIEIKDFSFGVENPRDIGSSTGGAGAGKVRFNQFQVTHAHPVLCKRCASSFANPGTK
jgi:hypothetical protein